MKITLTALSGCEERKHGDMVIVVEKSNVAGA
jgi:hypothetical protein